MIRLFAINCTALMLLTSCAGGLRGVVDPALATIREVMDSKIRRAESLGDSMVLDLVALSRQLRIEADRAEAATCRGSHTALVRYARTSQEARDLVLRACGLDVRGVESVTTGVTTDE